MVLRLVVLLLVLALLARRFLPRYRMGWALPVTVVVVLLVVRTAGYLTGDSSSGSTS